MKQKPFPLTEAERNDPFVWLMLLERGRRTADFELAAIALCELKRLGVEVRFRKRQQKSTDSSQ